MFGFNEIIAIVIICVIIFGGKKAFLKVYKDWKGIKDDIKKIDNETKEVKEIIKDVK